MTRPLCWVIDNYEYRPCNAPWREFKLPVCLHGHSYHSEENIGRLNRIMTSPWLSWLNNIINSAFRAKTHDDLNYKDIHYCPPISPVKVYDLELNGIKDYGWEDLLLAITDHDKIAGCHELIEVEPGLIEKTTISEELTLRFRDQTIHLGVHGIPYKNSDQTHRDLQEMRFKGDISGIFELLAEKECLVIINHTLWHLTLSGDFEQAIYSFIKKYRDKIHALEFNGLRRRDENDRVIDLAKEFNLPLVGGGDRHTPIASLVFTATNDAETFSDFIEEVKDGWGVTIIKPDYFFPMGWKMFVRILQYVRYYKEIAYYKKIPLRSYPLPDRIFLDAVADIAGKTTKFLTRLNLVR